MHTALVCIEKHGKLGASGMSDFMEIINPQKMIGKLYFQGEVVEEYRVDQCDKCSKLTKWDAFGYQIGYDRTEKMIWFCAGCR